jgi:hypothetical protein
MYARRKRLVPSNFILFFCCSRSCKRSKIAVRLYQRGLIRKPLPEIGVILLHDVERCFVGEIAMVLGK